MTAYLALFLYLLPILAAAQSEPKTLCFNSGSDDRFWYARTQRAAFLVSNPPSNWGPSCNGSSWIAPTAEGLAPSGTIGTYSMHSRVFRIPSGVQVLGGELHIAYDERISGISMNNRGLSVPCAADCARSCSTIPLPANLFSPAVNRLSLMLSSMGGSHWGLSYSLCVFYVYPSTHTPSPTRTPNPVESWTPIPTWTPTWSPTPQPPTATPTPTYTVTWTGTLPTVLWTWSPTNTMTIPATDTPTYAGTWTHTLTGTLPSSTPTATATVTPTYANGSGDCGRVHRWLRSGDPEEAADNPWIERIVDTTDFAAPCGSSVWMSDNADGTSRPYPCVTSPPRVFTVQRYFYLSPREAAEGRFHLCYTADDIGRVKVNGVLVSECLTHPTGFETGNNCMDLHPGGLGLDLPASVFKHGPNLVEFEAEDAYCYNMGISYELWMDLPAPCPPTPTPTYNPIVGSCGRIEQCYHSGDTEELVQNPQILPISGLTPWPSPCPHSTWVTDNPEAFARQYPCVTTPPRNILITRLLNLSPNQVLDGRFTLCINADDAIRVAVNGIQVAECLSAPTGWETGHSCYTMFPGGYQTSLPSSVFRVGSNTLEFLASDAYCYQIGLSYSLCVNIPVDCTPTNTWTITTTPTKTPTRSPTPTPTVTDTPTATSTFTSTWTPHAAYTKTHTSTVTWSPTITSTWTIVPTWTWTITPTKTPTRTGTITPTVTSTPTDTSIYTLSPTPTVSQTETWTVTTTPTVTPTRTVTYTPTETPTRTSTVMPTKTPTRTPTLTRTITNTRTPTFAVFPTKTPTFSPTVTPTWTWTITPTQTPTRTPTPT